MALWLAEGLLNKGHEVEVWYLYKKRPVQSDTIHQLVLDNKKPNGILQNLLLIPKLIKAIKKCKPDVVISHTHYANIICQPVSWLLRVPKRIAVQHSPVGKNPRLARWFDLLWGTCGFYTDNVTVSCAVEHSVSRYPENYKRKLHVVYNGIPRLEQPPVLREEVRSRLNLPKGCFLLVNVGRLSYPKNQVAILKALSHLPDVHLVVVGEGELRDKLTAEAGRLKVSDRVHFIGEVTSSEVLYILHASDLFVFPSHFEGMSMSLLEVMQIGKPIIASDIPSNIELLGDTALFVKPEDFTGLVKNVRMLQEDSELRQNLIEKTKARAALFSLENMVNNYERLLTGQERR